MEISTLFIIIKETLIFNKIVMKKLLLLLLLSIFSVNSTFAYTNEDWKVESWLDERVKDDEGDKIKLNSTTFFPTWFLDWTIIQKAPVQPIWAGRTHWDDRIDFNKFNCNTASWNALFNKKCFLRHSWVFTKIDISKDADLSGQTNYPSLNNVMVAEVDARYDENFSFWVAGFGVSSQWWIAQWGLQGWPWAEIWNSSHNAKQWAAIQVFAMDKDGNEITDWNGFPIWFPITVNGEDITEKVGERNVVTSLNRKLFRGYCLKNGVEDYSMLASDPNCKVAWNMIFSLYI